MRVTHKTAWALVLAACLFLAAGAAAQNDDGYDPGRDGPDPGLGLLALFGLIVCLVLIGVGIVVGLAVLAGVAALLAVGIISSSVLVGFTRNRPSAGFRALFLQLGGIGGIACGIGVALLVLWIGSLEVHWGWAVLVGGAAGLGCALGIALLFNLAWTRLLDWGSNRFKARQGAQASPAPNRAAARSASGRSSGGTS